jgi:hypothetical protein
MIQRLRDYPQIAALERRAVLDNAARAESAGWIDDAVAKACRTLFGVSASDISEAYDDDYEDDLEEEVEEEGAADPDRPDYYFIAYLPEHQQVAELERLGWDARDEQGRPLLVLRYIMQPLLAALSGDYGATLPKPPGSDPEEWGSSLAEAARRFSPKSRR